MEKHHDNNAPLLYDDSMDLMSHEFSTLELEQLYADFSELTDSDMQLFFKDLQLIEALPNQTSFHLQPPHQPLAVHIHR